MSVRQSPWGLINAKYTKTLYYIFQNFVAWGLLHSCKCRKNDAHVWALMGFDG
jgi:hypothetical protein